MRDNWINQVDLAAQLGISTRRVRDLRSLGLPSNGAYGHSRRYPWPGARDWYLAYVRQCDADRGCPVGHRVDRARTRALTAQAEREEIALQEEKAQLIPRKEILAALRKARKRDRERGGGGGEALQDFKSLLGI